MEKSYLVNILAWENSRLFGTLQTVSQPNDVWETSVEIPYWWRVIWQTWVNRVMLLIGRAMRETCFNQSEASTTRILVGSDASSVWNFCARLSDVISRGNYHWIVASRNVGCFLRLRTYKMDIFLAKACFLSWTSPRIISLPNYEKKNGKFGQNHGFKSPMEQSGIFFLSQITGKE